MAGRKEVSVPKSVPGSRISTPKSEDLGRERKKRAMKAGRERGIRGNLLLEIG